MKRFGSSTLIGYSELAPTVRQSGEYLDYGPISREAAATRGLGTDRALVGAQAAADIAKLTPQEEIQRWREINPDFEREAQ